MNPGYKDEPGVWHGEGGMSSMTSEAMHHSYMMSAHLAGNPHYAGLNGDMYYGGGASLPLLPLHCNPYGGYSNNYTHPSSYLTSSHLASQHHQALASMSANSLNSLTNSNNVSTKSAHLNSINYIPAIDNFAPLSLSSAHYLPGVPLLVRNSSVDGSEDNTDNSSNGSGSACDVNSNIAGAVQGSNVNPFFFPTKEVR